jgi:hypothetical protein
VLHCTCAQVLAAAADRRSVIAGGLPRRLAPRHRRDGIFMIGCGGGLGADVSVGVSS